MAKVIVLSFQDGEDPTYVKLDNLPILMLVDEAEIDEDFMWSPPTDCEEIPNHVHVEDLIFQTEVNENLEDPREIVRGWFSNEPS